MMNVIYTPAQRDRLKDAYDIAAGSRLETFTFDGVEYHTGYAKYLLQFLDQKFGPSTTARNHHHG